MNLVARHRKETRELINHCTALKKQAGSNNKKKKEVQLEVERLQADLRARHAQEAQDLEPPSSEAHESESTTDQSQAEPIQGKEEIVVNDSVGEDLDPAELLAEIESIQQMPEPQVKKAELKEPIRGTKKKKRMEKLAQKQLEELRIREEALREVAGQVDLRQVELDSISSLCQKNGLIPEEVPADGHCLFASIRDQLHVHHDKEVLVSQLRTQAAQHIRTNKERFAPFLFDEISLTTRDVESYCQELENTAVWGGDLEIQVLAEIYDCPITVFFSDRSTHQVHPEGKNPELKLVYYKHYYGLGEHYNSLRSVDS